MKFLKLSKGEIMRYFLVSLLLLILLCPSAAQDETPFPVVQAEDVFAEGVTVLERLSVIDFDWENRLVYYFNPETSLWTSYAYPDEVVRFNRYKERGDGSFLLQRGNDDNGRLTSYADEWLFDPKTGSISRDNLYCGRIADLPNEGEWFLHRLDTGQYVLCDSATGEHIALPDNLQAEISCGSFPDASIQSPNREWVVFYTCGDDPMKVYSMNTQTGNILFLGEIYIVQFPYSRWINDETILMDVPLSLTSSSLLSGEYSIANPSIANSLLNIGVDRDIDVSRNHIIWDEQFISDDYDIHNTIHLLNTDTYEESIVYEQFCEYEEESECWHGGAVAISPSLRYIAYGNSSFGAGEFGVSGFMIWDTVTKEAVYELESSQTIKNIHWIDDDRFVMSYGANFYDEETVISLMDIRHNPPLETILEANSPYSNLSFVPNNLAILLTDTSYADRIYNFSTEEESFIFQQEINGYIIWDVMENETLAIATAWIDDRPSRWRIRLDAISEEES
jgi:hypothetical protein